MGVINLKKIVIIGGGTSGLFSGIYIKKFCPDCEVTIVERLERIGKKILATGNGRCNFSNIHVNNKKYNNTSFVNSTLKELDYKHLIEELEGLGLMTVTDSEGRAYPYSEMANSFLDVLRINIKKLGVIEKCNFDVHKITNIGTDNEPKFVIEDTRKQRLQADFIVLATGGKASPLLGSNGSGYSLVKPWHIKVTHTEPGLVGVKVDPQSIKGLAGLRIRPKVSLWDKKAKQKVWEENGEVLFKEDGVSGIVIMQMASIIARGEIVKASNHYSFEFDLMPKFDEETLFSMLVKRREMMGECETSDFLNGIFPKVLGFNLIKRSKIDLSSRIENITMKDLIRLTDTIKYYTLDYKGLYGFERAQVTVGGIELSEINKRTLEFVRIPQMYCCGEVLDVDGECGGYNMHWALASGYVVAKSIKEKCEASE